MSVQTRLKLLETLETTLEAEVLSAASMNKNDSEFLFATNFIGVLSQAIRDIRHQ